MKTRNFLKVSLLFMACLGMVSCGDDDKAPEIVPDSIGEKTEYYIAGKVTATDGTALKDVTVATGDASEKTNEKGEFSLTVADKGQTYNVKFTKEGYVEANNTVEIAGNAANRNTVVLNAIMSKQAVEVAVEPEKGAIVTENGATESTEEIQENTAAVEIPANAVDEAATVTVTPYVEPADNAEESAGQKEEAVALTNLSIVSSSQEPLKEDVTLHVSNKSTADEYFDEGTMEVYKKEAARAASWTKIGTAKFVAATNSYQFTIAKGQTLSGDYSIRVASTKVVSNTQTKLVKEDSKSNAGNMNAIDFEFPYEATLGWSYEVSEGSVGNGILSQILASISSQEGSTAGTYEVSKVFKTQISGNHNLYYSIKTKYVVKEYTFSVNGKNVTIKITNNLGVEFSYKNEDADTHSGGGSK